MTDPLEGLKKAGLPIPPTMPKPLPTMHPGTSDPALDRAVWALQKEYPQDVEGVDINPMSWQNIWAGSNIFGTTEHKPGQYRQHIELNPSMDIAFPQWEVDSTLAHELQHVRQNRTAPVSSVDRLKEVMSVPYGKQPNEVDADKAEQEWMRTHEPPLDTVPFQQRVATLAALPKMLPFPSK